MRHTRREYVRRTLRPLVALAMVTLMSAGCSNARIETGAGDSGGNIAATREQAVRFATCMRANGVSDFPDPDASGALNVEGVVNDSKLDPSSTAWKQAIGACKDLKLPGFTDNKRGAQEQEHAVRFAQCIRDNGVKDFPDPAPDGPLVDTNRIPSVDGTGGRGDLAPLREAMQKCRDFAAGAGVRGR